MGIQDQAYQTGVVTSFDGPGGLLETLLAFIIGTEVTAESLSGSGAAWSGTLANSPIGYGRLLVDYTIAGTPYQAQDDGAGNIVGDQLNVGTIDYTTGAYSITFAASVTGTPTADYLYGNPGQDWRQLFKRNSQDNAGIPNEPWGSECKECILHNTGQSGQENILVGLREWKQLSQDKFGWDMNGYINYLTDQPWDANYTEHGLHHYSTSTNSWYNHPQLPLVDDTMYYWFYVNRQRIIVVVKVQSNYESLYLGFGRRFGLPSEYPYPMVIKGPSYNGYRFSILTASRLMCVKAYWQSTGYQFWCIDPSGTYRIPYGTTIYQSRGCSMEPYASFEETGIVGKTPVDDYVHLQPSYVVDRAAKNVLMDLDGAYISLAAGIQSEDVLHAGGIKHRVFQNVYRNSWFDFMAIEEQVGTTTTTTTSTTSTTTTTTSTTTTSTTSTTTTSTSTTSTTTTISTTTTTTTTV